MDTPKEYPRVLIVGESFAKLTGGGITLSNLFKGWPKESLAVVGDLMFQPNTDVCSQYYQLGESEWKFAWPISSFLKNGRKSGEIKISEETVESGIPPDKPYGWQRANGISSRNNFLYRVLTTINGSVGVEAVARRLILSAGLTKWIAHFQPDLIYTQLASIQTVSLTNDLAKAFRIPYVLHIMDDWPSTLYADKLLAPYLRRRLDKEFKGLLSCASGFLGICQKMCDVYQEKYLRPCIPFHNPVELDRWLLASKKEWKANTPFRMMYRGHYGSGVQLSLVDICDAVNELYQAGRSVQFEITLTPTCDPQMRQLLERPGCVIVRELIPYEEVPSALANADLLILAYDFDTPAINFNK